MLTNQANGSSPEGRVVVRFADDELLEGVAGDLDLDRPDFSIVVTDRSNNREAIVPWLSVKTLLMRREEFEAGAACDLRKVVIHFWAGEVLKGYLATGPDRHLHGMAVPLISPTLDEIEVFGIPYAAVKGVFFVKTWDSRAPVYEKETGHWFSDRPDTPLLDLLGEIRVLSSMHVRGELDSVEFERRRRQVLARL